MPFLNKECPTCGKSFHHCSSCNDTEVWHGLYCSYKCFTLSEDFIVDEYYFNEFINSLTEQQQAYLYIFLFRTKDINLIDFLKKFKQEMQSFFGAPSFVKREADEVAQVLTNIKEE